jgi:hypothetical protein
VRTDRGPRAGVGEEGKNIGEKMLGKMLEQFLR